ncbi:MAG: hypothetical protein OXE43_02980 [Chloroflexi bacterium]|nr:hypothetical protein [Chloroflexota bacterium]
MKGEQPFILLRARVRDDRETFSAWFRSQHLREVAKIPGMASVQWGETREGTMLGVYCFEDPRSMQGAFGSAEAAYARGMWASWSDKLEEFSVEMHFALTPPTMTLSFN